MDGILLVNKPSRWTSHDVCQFVKKRFKLGKVGHTGTLDPQATGVLVLLIGKYTKLSAQFTNVEKEYAGTMELGLSTTTQDGDGEVVARRDWHGVRPAEVYTVFERFRGPQKQVPPMVSAIRSHGVRLYNLARRGREIHRRPRDIIVYAFTCDRIYLPFIDFAIITSKGTYIRTVAHDVGEALHTGAYLKSLRRLRNGTFHLSECVSIDDLKKVHTQAELAQMLYKKPTVGV